MFVEYIYQPDSKDQHAFHRGIYGGFSHTGKGLYHFTFVKVLTNLTDLGPDDGGTTVIYAARQITARPIQVVTNSLAIGHLFADDDQAEVMLIGGNLYPRTGVCVGPMATGSLADLHADLCLFSLAGIFENEGYNINLPMAQVEQVMLQQATRSVILMDASKFGRKSLVRVCSLDEVDQIVTDGNIDQTWSQRLGDRLHVVRPESGV